MGGAGAAAEEEEEAEEEGEEEAGTENGSASPHPVPLCWMDNSPHLKSKFSGFLPSLRPGRFLKT